MRSPSPVTGCVAPPASPAGRVWCAVRRAHPLPVELAVLVATVLVWQVLRLPFEVGPARAAAATRDLIDLERALGLFREDRIAAFVQGREHLLVLARWWYGNMDEGPVLGILAAMWFIDPRRYPTVRTAFVLAHVPAVLVVALYPSAPPRWLEGYPYAVAPPAGLEGGLRNSTAAAVSLHVGIPVLLALAAVWMRPRAPLAWGLWIFPAVVLFVVVGTGHHLFADAAIGTACALAGWWAARRFHGRVPPAARVACPVRIAVTACGIAAAVLLISWALFGTLA